MLARKVQASEGPAPPGHGLCMQLRRARHFNAAIFVLEHHPQSGGEAMDDVALGGPSRAYQTGAQGTHQGGWAADVEADHRATERLRFEDDVAARVMQAWKQKHVRSAIHPEQLLLRHMTPEAHRIYQSKSFP